jgi:hypothetical protein
LAGGLGLVPGEWGRVEVVLGQLRLFQERAQGLRADFLGYRQGCVRALEAATAAGVSARGHVWADPQLRVLAQVALVEAGGDAAGLSAVLAELPAEQVAGLFAGMSPEAVAALVRLDPAAVGNLDGVPLLVRAAANRVRAQADLARARAAGDTKEIELLTGADGAGGLLAAGSSLAMYDPGNDHYGVLWGDPGATNVAVFVPGVGGDGNIPGWVQDARNIYARAPGSAVIMWKGYDDPGFEGPLDSDVVNAGFDDRARAGARALTSFCSDGLQLNHAQSLTVVAHSYGSVVAGVALNADGLRPARVVTAGSPGMTVDDISQLHLKSGQFFAEHAPGDPVANQLGGFGTDPASPLFGGSRLATNAAGMKPVSGHSAYFQPNTQALSGIGDVVSGHVPAADIQHASVADQTGAVVTRVANLPGPLLDDLARHDHDPLVQAVAHADNFVAGNLGTAARNTVDAAEHAAEDTLDTVEGWFS